MRECQHEKREGETLNAERGKNESHGRVKIQISAVPDVDDLHCDWMVPAVSWYLCLVDFEDLD